MKRTILLILTVLPVLSACKKKSINCGVECNYEETALVKFGFEGITLAQEDQRASFGGIDHAFTSENDWDNWHKDANNEFGFININYEEGDISQRIAELVTDPFDANNQVLKFQINETNVYKNGKPLKSRVQVQYHDTKCIKEYYQTINIMLPTEMEVIKNYPDKIVWLSIFEFWNNANFSGEKYPFRITVGLHKGPNVGDEIHYNVEAQTFKQPNNFTDVWEETNTSFNVPFNQWMELELYLLEGDKSNGRFYMAVTPEGGTKEVLFDITNTTQHPKEKCPDGFTHFQPLKWYTSSELTDFVQSQNSSLVIYWDDWQAWKNKAP